jgi:hypothetical protein
MAFLPKEAILIIIVSDNADMEWGKGLQMNNRLQQRIVKVVVAIVLFTFLISIVPWAAIIY